jgi:hypothetical protein
MQRILKRIFLCLFLGLFPSFLSIMFAAGIENSVSYWYQNILYWNVFLASKLASAGVLPFCSNCELMSLLQILFYGFVIGALGYAALIFCVLEIYSKRRQQILR